MAYRRRSPLTAGARFILVFLAESSEPKSYLDIADGAKLSYFHTRHLCAELVKKGFILRTRDGKQPVFSFNRDYKTEPPVIVFDSGVLPTPALPGQRSRIVSIDKEGKPMLAPQGVL